MSSMQEEIIWISERTTGLQTTVGLYEQWTEQSDPLNDFHVFRKWPTD